MSASLRAASLALAAAFSLAGCGALPGGPGGSTGPAAPFSNPAMTPQSAREAVRIGASTRAEVEAALGKATVVRFDSGWEVWAYRAKLRESDAGRTEFVILFAPDGVVRKTRIRVPGAPG